MWYPIRAKGLEKDGGLFLDKRSEKTPLSN